MIARSVQISALRAFVVLTLISSISATVTFAREEDFSHARAVDTKRQVDGVGLDAVTNLVGIAEGLAGSGLVGSQPGTQAGTEAQARDIETKRQLGGLPVGGVLGEVTGLLGGLGGLGGGLGGLGGSQPEQPAGEDAQTRAIETKRQINGLPVGGLLGPVEGIVGGLGGIGGSQPEQPAGENAQARAIETKRQIDGVPVPVGEVGSLVGGITGLLGGGLGDLSGSQPGPQASGATSQDPTGSDTPAGSATQARRSRMKREFVKAPEVRRDIDGEASNEKRQDDDGPADPVTGLLASLTGGILGGGGDD
ncbi:hypothetical protein K435DRAFT_968658 [Dendrothele bispora CBS 962.96]|uniref:Uncharacterized protein n=1 Tax=Dendrothele bispora (strain CBS 962.96) TaxID=1314807 RepID=A0A4S8LMJ8_DENBC|nr:hypothetical protein K435DRAFT_968658 [Dendrothele bispora CBS 962.96]